MSKNEDWIKRGREGYRFREEWLYTVSPTHLYLNRRKWLRDLVGGVLGQSGHSSLRILDFGGGDGWWSRYFARELGCDVVCFDPSTSFTHLAQREFNQERVGRARGESGGCVFTDDLSNNALYVLQRA